MSLYGALFSGVSGLRSQSTKIAVISDNISNVNTFGYKAGQGVFQTLVTTSGGGTAYSPGGVIGGSRQLVSQQGLLQTTNSPTDIAVSGSGLFVVNQLGDSTGQFLYTRAGSFTQDASGNFKNASGFFLQAWPLDREGRLPGDPGNENTISSANLSSLQTVNVQNLTGVAASTTSITLSANLKASQAVLAGAGITGDMDSNDTINRLNKATDIIIPQGAGSDSLAKGDVMNISTSANTTGVDYTYGGFTVGRLVTSGAGGDYGSAVLGGSTGGETTLLATPFSITNTSAVVTVTHASHGLSDGEVVTLSGNLVDVGNIDADDFNGTFVVSNVTTNTYDITVATTATSTTTGGTTGVLADIRPFADAGFILDAASATGNFLGTTGTSLFSTAALSFTITTLTTGTVTFTYKNSAPNAQAGEFNSLNSLATAISAVDGLTARVSGGRLYVSAINATEDLVFANGAATGTDGSTEGTATYGINWIRELGLEADGTVDGAANQFSTMQGLADLINANGDITATISSPLSDSEISINLDDPLGTITFADASSGNTGSLVAALGFTDSLEGAAYSTAQTTGTLGPAYDATDPNKNMASGSITPQFSRPIRIYDSLGTGHDLNVSFIKTGINTWQAEVYAINASEVTTTLGNGLLSYGTITFNGDGSLLSLTGGVSGLNSDITVSWTNQAEDSEISFNWGTAGIVGTGKTDGLSQFDAAYKVNFANQNGAPVGELTGVSIDEDGFVVVSYSNGETQKLFKIPLADFPNPDELQGQSGNVYLQSSASGEVNLAQAGSSGVGKIVSSSLEASNVELADQLTDMIIAQRAYQANTKIISTASGLLDELNRAIT